jgi:hypothetical protein
MGYTKENSMRQMGYVLIAVGAVMAGVAYMSLPLHAPTEQPRRFSMSTSPPVTGIGNSSLWRTKKAASTICVPFWETI